MTTERKVQLVLNDKAIRSVLVRHLERMSKPPKAILQELRVHNGNAIADVVTIHTHAHCYEIKGENDNIYRALKQSKYYDFAFKRNTLVTTEKSINTARKIMPNYWGLIVVKSKNDQPSITHIRKALTNPNFSKKLALLTLWKSELLAADFSPQPKSSKSFNRLQLADLISKELTEKNLLNFIGTKLVERNSNQEMTPTYT